MLSISKGFIYVTTTLWCAGEFTARFFAWGARALVSPRNLRRTLVLTALALGVAVFIAVN